MRYFTPILLLFIFLGNKSFAQGVCYSCNSTNTINSGLIFCLPFSGNAFDASTNGYSGTVSATLIPDRNSVPNSAYQFNGTTNYIDIPKLLPSSLTVFSISIWIKPGVNSSDAFFLFEGDNNCGNDLFLVIKNSTIKICANKNATLNGLTYASDAYTFPTSIVNVWTHLVWVMQGSVSYLYANGNLVLTSTNFGNGSGYRYPLSFGSKNDGSGGSCGAPRMMYYTGAIDDVRMYNRSVSAAEVSALYNNVIPPVINPIANQSICPLDSIRVNPFVTGASGYNWSPPTGVSNTSIQNPWFKPSSPQTYILTASYLGCDTRDTFDVTFKSVPNISSLADKTICLGDSFQINPTVVGGTTYNWIPSFGVSNVNILNPYFKPTIDTSYILSASNGFCSIKDTFKVHLNPSVVITPISDKNVCFGDTIQVNPIITGATNFHWTPSYRISDVNIQNPLFFPLLDTFYVITAANANCSSVDTFRIQHNNIQANAGLDQSICNGQTVDLNGTGSGGIFSWIPNKNISDDSIASPKVNPDTTTIYYLSVKNGSCLSRDSVIITVNPLKSNIITSDSTICAGDTIVLTGFVNFPNFTWSPASQLINGNGMTPKVFPVKDTWYYLSVTDGTCNYKDSVKVSLANLTIDAGVDSLICFGDSIQLSANFQSDFSYKWTPNSGLNSDNIFNPIAKPITDISYLLEISKGNCKAFDTVNITVKKFPIVDAGPDQFVCKDAVVKLNGSIMDFSTFYWSPSTGLSDIKVLDPVLISTNSFKYVLVGNNGKCLSTDTVNIYVNPPVIARFSVTPSIGPAPLITVYNNTSQNAWFYNWDFGDGQGYSNQRNPSYEYTKFGKFVVWLYAKDSLGCIDSTSTEIRVNSNTYLKIPNVFSPNSDSVNDRFGILYESGEFIFLEYTIYNRWGQQLFHTKLPGGNWWDGSFEGNPCPEGVYFYILNAQTTFGTTYDLHGTITLIR